MTAVPINVVEPAACLCCDLFGRYSPATNLVIATRTGATVSLCEDCRALLVERIGVCRPVGTPDPRTAAEWRLRSELLWRISRARWHRTPGDDGDKADAVGAIAHAAQRCALVASLLEGEEGEQPEWTEDAAREARRAIRALGSRR